MTDGREAVTRPKLHHINLKTTRLQEMIDWYGTVVGTEAMHQFPGGAWLTNDEANQRIALLSPPRLSDDPEKLAHAGVHHTAFEYDSIDDLLAAYTRLKAEGIKPHAGLDHLTFGYEIRHRRKEVETIASSIASIPPPK